MPLSKYKRNELYRHVESFELTDPKMFEDARIGENLSICTLVKAKVDVYKDYDSLVIESLDSNLKAFYIWNKFHSRNIAMKRLDSKSNTPLNTVNIDTDFVDSGRCVCTRNGYGYHAKAGYGYRWNVTKQNTSNEWPHCCGVIYFPSKKAKDNFCKYAYNYSDDKYDCLESKAMCGLRIVSVSADYFYWIPQIDWEKISDHELWKKGMYDEAVLDTMQLKWDEKKERIVKK